MLGSTKKLTSVLPRSAGTFLISRVPTCLNASVVSRMKFDFVDGKLPDAKQILSLPIQRG